MNRFIGLPKLLALTTMVSSCSLHHPDQDNYLIHSSAAATDRLLTTIERGFQSRRENVRMEMPGSEVQTIYRVEGQNAHVILTPIPDDRCNPNAPGVATFKEGLARVDLVFRSQSSAVRDSSRNRLEGAFKASGINYEKFRDCSEIHHKDRYSTDL